MALNFPNPALQTPLNEFSPDSTPAKSTNGVTYIWTNNEKWVASSVVFNDIYVNKTGDNMTGNLTLGTDKITLNATDGSAYFKQVIQSMVTASDAGCFQAGYGGFVFASIYGDGRGAFSNVNVGATAGVPNILLNSDGSASFTAKVTSASTVAGDGGTTLTTKDYVDAAAGGAGAWTQTGTNLYPTTAEFVGIGTASPSSYAKLAVLQAATIPTYGEVSAIFSDGSTGSARFHHATGNVKLSADVELAFGTGPSATEQMRIDDSGRLLVGTSTYSGNTRVVISGRNDGNAAGTLVLESSTSSPADGNTLGNIRYGTSGNTASLAGAAIGAERDGGTWTNNSSMPTRLVFSTTADGASTPTGRLHIDSSGDVKIGGTLPSAPKITLDADGSATFAGGVTRTNVNPSSVGDFGYRVEYGSDAPGEITYVGTRLSGANQAFAHWNGSALMAGIGADGSATFAGTVTTRDSFIADGGIAEIYYKGTLLDRFPLRVYSDYGGIKTPKFLVRNTGSVFINGDTTSATIKLENDGTASFAGTVASDGQFHTATRFLVSRTGYSEIFTAQNGGVNQIRMFSDGTASFTGTVTATVVPPSDARFKENITPANPQLADVVALGKLLKNYDWNDDAPLNEEIRSQRQLGLIAQEVAEVCPSLVKDINRTKTMEITPAVIGPKGRVITEAVTEEVDDSYKGLSQDALIMKLIGAVSEQNALIQSLEAEVTALKGTSTADS